MELMKSVVIVLTFAAFAAASKAALCNKYPPLIGFEIDKVSCRRSNDKQKRDIRNHDKMNAI